MLPIASSPSSQTGPLERSRLNNSGRKLNRCCKSRAVTGHSARLSEVSRGATVGMLKKLVKFVHLRQLKLVKFLQAPISPSNRQSFQLRKRVQFNCRTSERTVSLRHSRDTRLKMGKWHQSKKSQIMKKVSGGTEHSKLLLFVLRGEKEACISSALSLSISSSAACDKKYSTVARTSYLCIPNTALITS